MADAPERRGLFGRVKSGQTTREAPPANDRAAAKRLERVSRSLKENNDFLVAWLTKKFGDETVAREIAQDAHLRVWRWAQQSEVDDPKALLFKTAANLAVNEFKARRRYRSNHVEESPDSLGSLIESLPAQDPSPERTTSAREDCRACAEAIDDMPPAVRRAFVMSRFEGLTYREIAHRLRVSESSVEKYIISALRTLRVAVAQEEPRETVVSLTRHRRKPKYSSGRTRSAGLIKGPHE